MPLSLNQAIDEQFWSTQYSVKETIKTPTLYKENIKFDPDNA
jgi:hypothetical protein